jgi:hypothetical protein
MNLVARRRRGDESPIYFVRMIEARKKLEPRALGCYGGSIGLAVEKLESRYIDFYDLGGGE